MRVQQVHNLLNKLGRRKWNVHLKETYSHGEGVLVYLARYLRGGPISNRRILAIEHGHVSFNYGREKFARMSLPLCDFIGRYLQHVPLPNSIRVRSYGLYHQSCKGDLELCRRILGQRPVEDPGFVDWQTLLGEVAESHPERCPVCGKRLISIESFPRSKYLRCSELPQQWQVIYDKAA